MSPLCQHSTVANVEIVTGAGASLVTLCPNELYAKQIPPILRSHGEKTRGARQCGAKTRRYLHKHGIFRLKE